MTVSAQEFLDVIFESVPDGETVLVSKQLSKGFANASAPSRSFDSWMKRGKSATYFNISTVRLPEDDQPLRRRSEDCTAVYCMVLDDIGSKVDDPPVEPSWILETSPGSFQWGYLIDPTEELTRFAALMDSIADAGYTDNGAKGFNRLMRLPGSVNTKPGRDNFRATLKLWNPYQSFGSLDDLAEAFNVEIGVVKAKDVKASSAIDATDLEINDPLVDWFANNQMIVDDEGEWLTVICPNADSHTTGDDTCRYSPLGRGHGDWKMRRSFKCFHEHCAEIDFFALVLKMGGPHVRRYDPLPWLQNRYVYVQDGRRICDLESLSRGGLYDASLEEFNDLYAHMNIHMPSAKDPKRHVKAKTALMEEENTIKVRRYDVVPYTLQEAKRGGITVDEAGEPVVNTYLPPRHDAKPKDLDIFLEHIDFLLPDNNDAEIFLSWLAYKLQNPRSRSYGVVMVAEDTFGVGRSWLGDVLRAVWTLGNVQSVDIGDLTGHGPSSGFNDWASGSQMVIIEEAHDSDNQTHYKAYERIKTLVDPRVTTMQINSKYGSKRQERVWFNLLVFSNHGDAFNLPKGERRLAVFANPTEKQSEEYYERLWGAYTTSGKHLAAAIFEFLMARDVSSFNHATPPMTEAKRTMVERSASPGQLIAEAIRQRAMGELVTRHMLFDLWEEAERCEHLENTMTNNMQRRLIEKLWSDLPKLKGSKNGLRTRVRGAGIEEVRALRNADHWRKHFADGLDEEMKTDLKNQLGKTGKGIGHDVYDANGIQTISEPA